MAVFSERSRRPGGVSVQEKEREGEEGVGLSWVSAQRKRKRLTSGVQASASGGGESRYPFGTVHYWASGRIWGWANLVPLGLLFFSLFPFHFLFLISDLIQILCNLDSKHFKKIPKLF
jgi:hypothetical protein